MAGFKPVLSLSDLGVWGCTCKLQVPASFWCEVIRQ